MEKKFKALRFVGSVYKVFGIITGVLTVISSIGFCVMSMLSGSLIDLLINTASHNLGNGGSSGPAGLFSGILGGVIAGGFILLYGGIASITLYAVGEGIYLAIGIEENTRLTAFLLQQQNK
jgi:hypothetical protein